MTPLPRIPYICMLLLLRVPAMFTATCYDGLLVAWRRPLGAAGRLCSTLA